MNGPSNSAWPTGSDFLDLVEAAAEGASTFTGTQNDGFGQKLPHTINSLGTVLSLLYRAACCEWGCRGGDHQAEWLVSRVVNQGMASYRLLRSAFYDESLMVTRGLGEIANLLWRFREPGQFDQWRTLSRRDRKKQFSPSAVRHALKNTLPIGAPISNDRYRLLCEVGSHPVPWTGPNLFSGGTRPMLGQVVQPAGLMIAVNELSYAVAIAAVPVGKFLELRDDIRKELSEASQILLKSIGGVTIDNYEELTAEQVKSAAAAARHQVFI